VEQQSPRNPRGNIDLTKHFCLALLGASSARRWFQ
jgi:hypothetical protein